VANKNRSSKSPKKRAATKVVSGQTDPLPASPLPKDSPCKKRLDKSTRPVAASAHKSSRPALFSWLGFILVLLACSAWVLTHAYLVDTVTVRLCENMDAGIPAEKRMPVFLSEIAFDGYMWNRHAEHLGEGGHWRLGHTDVDNSPDGREVHWNSGFALYLRGLGEIYRAITGDTLRNSIFRMSIWANTILLLLAIGIFATLSARRFGPLCGTVIAIGMVAVPTFYEGFMPAYPDHHGLIAFTLLGTLFGIAWAGAGWVQTADGTSFAPPRSLKQARHGMIFSAICGAAGLWISALSMAIALGTIGVGALASVLLAKNMAKKSGCVFHSGLWKTWAIWGTCGSIVFYLVETFPSNMGMRLEVNHPLYSFAWLGGGWAIAILSEWFLLPGKKHSPFPWKQLIFPILLCALLPITVILGGQLFYMAIDPFILRLNKMIAEALPLLVRIQTGGLTWQMAFGWFPLLLVASVWLFFVRSVDGGTKAVLCFLAIPILLITALQFYQVRWGMMAGPVYIALAGIVIPQIWRLVPARLTERVLVAAMLAGFAFLFIAPSFSNCFSGSWAQFQKGTKDIPISFGQGLALLHRQMARAILDSGGDKPVVLLSSPNSSCILSTLGGFRTVGTLYWENVEGLKKAASALNSQSDDEALAKIRELGVTHISLMTWENFIAPFYGILYPQPVPEKSYETSFGKRALFDKVIPPWARPLAFPPNDLTKNLQQTVIMLQVAPDQSLNEAKFHLARFVRLVEGNPISAEFTLNEILDSSPESSLVRVELADILFAQKRYQDAITQIIAVLPDATPAQRSDLGRTFIPALYSAKEWKLRADLIRALVKPDDADAETLENAAWILSTAPDETARDAELALACCDRLEALPHTKQQLLLARSAALAAAGEFQKAAAAAREAAASNPADKNLQDRANEMSIAFDAGKIWTVGN
jgi:tetratricopeptide (TPR) repeat protein